MQFQIQSAVFFVGIISERKRQLDDEIEDGIKQPENKQIDERKTGVRNYYGKSQRNRVDNEDGEKMDVSDLEDDTGVNVDYGASGDEQSYAMKEAHQTANKKSHTPSSHHKDKGKLRQHGHHHSSKAKEKKVTHRDKQSRKSEELHRRDKDSEIVSKETDKCSQDYDHNDNASIVHLDGIADNSIAQGRKMDEKLDELKEMSLDVEQQNQLVDNDGNAKQLFSMNWSSTFLKLEVHNKVYKGSKLIALNLLFNPENLILNFSVH